MIRRLKSTVYTMQVAAGTNKTILALTDQVVMPISAALDAIKGNEDKGIGKSDPMIITQASLLSNFSCLEKIILLMAFVLSMAVSTKTESLFFLI